MCIRDSINAMTIHNYKRAKEPIDHTKEINIVSAIQAILISLPFVYMVCFNIILLVQKIKRRKKKESNSDDIIDPLVLVDYRQFEDSKSL